MWTAKTVLTLLLCFLEDLLFGGSIYGWPSLAYVYKDQGLFACTHNQTGVAGNNTVGCPDQDLLLPLGLTVGLIGLGLGALSVGWMFDRYGLRITRTITIVIGVSGTLCLAFADRTYAYLIFPGTFLTGTACISVMTTNFHVGLLAGKLAPLFNILYSGAISSAGIIYFFIKLAYDNGFSQRWSLLILSSLWILVAVTTFLLLPQFKILSAYGNGELQENYNREGHGSGRNVVSLGKGLREENLGAPRTIEHQPLPIKSLWYYMFSFGYISHVLYLSLLHVWVGLVIGIMNIWLTSIYKGDNVQVSHYTNVYSYVMFACGFLLSPFVGGMTDAVRRHLEGKSGGDLTNITRAMVFVPAFFVSSVAAILVAVFMLLEEAWSVYPVFTFMEFARDFCYGNVAAYIMLVFPMEHFGMLHGVMFAMTGVALAVQYGYVKWMEAAGYMPMVSLQLGLVVLSLLHPSIITVRYLRQRRPNVIFTTRL